MTFANRAAQDIRGRITNIYISIMLLIFPLFTGFSGYSNITLSKYAFFLAASGMWLAFILCLSIARRLPLPKLRSHHFAALAFAAVCCLSALLSPYGSESLIGAGRYDGLVTQLAYVLIFLGVSMFAELRKGHFVCLGLSVTLCSAVALLQLFNINIFGLFPGSYSHYDAGIRYSGAFLGTIGNTNVLSAYFCIALPALFALPVLSTDKRAWLVLIPIIPAVFVMLRARVAGGFVGMAFCALVAVPLLMTDIGRVRRALAAAGAVLVSAAAALAFTPEYSGGSFSWSFHFGALPVITLALAVLLILLAFALGHVHIRPSAKAMRILFAVLCVAALLAGLVFVYFSPAEEGTIYELSQVLHGNIDDKFGSSRIRIWRACLEVWSDYPLLGSGPDTLALRVDVNFSRYVEETGKTLASSVDNAHNEYLGYLLNTGILGLAAYLVLLLCGLRAWLKKLQNPGRCALGLGALCYCAQSFFALGLPLVAPLLWISLGLLLHPERKAPPPDEIPPEAPVPEVM